MKKKQKINKAVNRGEWVLLGLTALFLCVLFALRDRPAAVSVRPPSALPKPRDADSPPATVAPVDTPDSTGRVNINTADLAALCALPGIGEALAGRVVAYREEHGPFASPDEIMNVSGIGPAKFAAIEALIVTE